MASVTPFYMGKFPKLSAIVAQSRNNVIGRDGGLPWHLSSDLKLFKKHTMGKPVMMGRTTWEGLPFPLPGRSNLVLTRNRDYFSPGAEIFTSVRDLVGRGYEIAGRENLKEIMLVGGATLYEQLLPYCDRLYVTEVLAEIDGDAFFPVLKRDEWVISKEEEYARGVKDDYDFVFRILDRHR